jgi:D-3-phosphoglycerate dehydrogenase / 2-oxoglutarate reductase
MINIKLLNNISAKGTELFDESIYKVADDIKNPDAILVRSAKMHDYKINSNLLSVGRAGSGVNNIPLDEMSKSGVVVFNAPGANANAVKELVLSAMLIASRNLIDAWSYVKGLNSSNEELAKKIEDGKKRFAGCELPNKTLGLIGLGAIGVKVANVAIDLGMRVIGFDPCLSLTNAWDLNSNVQSAKNLDEILQETDFISFHVPLLSTTKNLINMKNINLLKKDVVLLNFARDGIIDDDAVTTAIERKIVKKYVTDFPKNKFKHNKNIISLPHLGASTAEAEDNCAIMVAQQTMDFIEHGNITNSVNLPNLSLQRKSNFRLSIINKNQPDMVAKISHTLGENSINIKHMANESRGDFAYNIIDVDEKIPPDIIDKLYQNDGIIKARTIKSH